MGTENTDIRVIKWESESKMIWILITSTKPWVRGLVSRERAKTLKYERERERERDREREREREKYDIF